MGVSYSCSCPLASDHDLESGLESIIVKSVSLGDDHVTTPERSISFNAQHHDSQPLILHKSPDSGNMILEGSVSFKQRQTTTLISVTPSADVHCLGLSSPKHQAAVKLQKVYKSFRTRRKLADCAVLVEQSWWKLLDFAELKHSSISFFDIEHHETAISRWSRAKTRAAKVGKGLSKNGKAQKLALQHWLEAIDPRHRYGHNLHFYYTNWLHSQSREPFFYWLDIGEGKEVNLEKCSRCKLQQQCIKYLGPMERKAYEVAVEDGKFLYTQSGEILDTSSEPHAKWIFVLSTSKALYVSKKKKGTFQHSSFLAGGATSAAGRLVVENGLLKAVWPHSGHYRPTPENFQDFIAFLTENNVDLTHVKMDPVDEDEKSIGKQKSSLHFRNSSEEDLGTDSVMENEGEIRSIATQEEETVVAPDDSSSQLSSILTTKLTNLEIPSRDELFMRMQGENETSVSTSDSVNIGDGYDSAKEEGILAEEDEEDKQEIIPAAAILERINSHKETKSYQLGKQLSCKWTTGAGPRIGCVRDYPSELQLRALEQVNLSPRSGRAQIKATFSPGSSPKASTPMSVVCRRSMEQCKVQLSSPLRR
ncbi:IQ domain-containing protein IQM2-like [Silene latifolia]|uniref:IQ domain-containing protein IQM2-like n=1 Tax=Silene latifolia TaxID=37657 RepID=UPI003D77A773